MLQLQGCAAVYGVVAVAAAAGGTEMAVDSDLEPLPKEVLKTASLPYPVAKVYAALLQSVERDGRTIVEASPLTTTLRVSYPFSFLANNWGGVMIVSCTEDDRGTKLMVIGSGRDTAARQRPIAVEIIHDLELALAR